MKRTPPGGRDVVLPYHPHSGRNPYQSMLYGVCASARIEPRRLDDLDGLDAIPVTDRDVVAHLHWTDTILQRVADRRRAKERIERMQATLDAFRDGGGDLIWTVHNALPHECRFPDLEAEVCQLIADRADAVHVMCEATADAVAPWYELPADRLAVIPHCSYLGVYPNYISRAEARTRLGLGHEHTVLTVFGGLRPYKALTGLLDAFEAAVTDHPNLRLVIAGKPIRLPDVDRLRSRCDRNPRVLAHVGGVAAGDIQLYMNAADAVVLPHGAALNSGLIALAHSFARPVIAPDLGCIAPQVTPATGVLFEPGDRESLARALAGAEAFKDPRFEAAALDWADKRRPEGMAIEFAELVARVVGYEDAPRASESANGPSGSVHQSVSSRPASE